MQNYSGLLTPQSNKKAENITFRDKNQFDARYFKGVVFVTLEKALTKYDDVSKLSCSAMSATDNSV